jgi:hypothetical protein
MALELIMNEDGQLGHGSGSTVTGGVFTITSVASTKVKATGKGVYRGPLTYSFAGGNFPGVVPGTARTLVDQTITPTAVKAKAEGLPVVREGDSGVMIGVGDNPAAPPPTLPISGPVEVVLAGQVKAKAQ